MKINKKNFNIAIITILINLLLLQLSCAQNYQPVLKTDSTSWTIAHQELFGISMDVFHTKTIQDSIFSYVFSNDMFNNYIGKLRENMEEGKVWYTSAVSNQEYLIMDMNLQTGDTFEFKPGVWGQVDSVYYLDVRKVIQFDLFSSRWNEPIKFIEGVGPNNAFSNLNDFDWFYVTCKYDQDVLNYVNNNTHFTGCMPDPTGVEFNSEGSNQFTIFPNPCSGTLNINGLSFNKTKLSIIDLYGRVLKQFYIESATDRIDLSDLTNGVYLLKAEVEGSAITKTLLIKH